LDYLFKTSECFILRNGVSDYNLNCYREDKHQQTAQKLRRNKAMSPPPSLPFWNTLYVQNNKGQRNSTSHRSAWGVDSEKVDYWTKIFPERVKLENKSSHVKLNKVVSSKSLLKHKIKRGVGVAEKKKSVENL